MIKLYIKKHVWNVEFLIFFQDKEINNNNNKDVNFWVNTLMHENHGSVCKHRWQ